MTTSPNKAHHPTALPLRGLAVAEGFHYVRS